MEQSLTTERLILEPDLLTVFQKLKIPNRPNVKKPVEPYELFKNAY